MFEKETIFAEIRLDAINVFREEKLPYTVTDVVKALDILFNVMEMPTDKALLNGFKRDFQDALTKTCITEVGKVAPLRTICDLLDPFMKRLLSFGKEISYREYQFYTFQPLAEKLGLSIIGYNNDSTAASWKADGTGRYILSFAGRYRNDSTHNSPEWDKAEIATALKYTLSAYVYLILTYKDRLLKGTPEIEEKYEPERVATPSDLQAYDFINYSKVSGEIKNKLIDCFILRHLLEKTCESINQIRLAVKQFVGREADVVVEHRLKKLLKDSRIQPVSTTLKTYCLTEPEKERLLEDTSNCAANKISFQNDLKQALQDTSLVTKVDDVFKQYMMFLENHFREGLSIETDDLLGETGSNGFLDYLEVGCGNEEKAQELYKKIINLSRSNDIAYRLSVGTAIRKLPEDFNPTLGVSNMERSVFLDTQVVLTMLCTSQEDFLPGEGTSYKTAMSIVGIGKRQNNIHLCVCDTYLIEIYLHLYHAAELMSFEDVRGFNQGLLSGNVFYKHFVSLNKDSLLPEGVESFSDYLHALFFIERADADVEFSTFRSRLSDIVREHMEENLGIKIIEVPRYTSADLKYSEEAFGWAIRNSNTTKAQNSLKRDAIVGKYLFDCREEPRPIFISRDYIFAGYRNHYAEGKRGLSYIWQLLSPIKFVSNNALIGMKIDESLISDELLLLVDKESKEKAKYFLDVTRQLTEQEGLSPLAKRERIEKIIAIFTGKEFADITEDDIDKMNDESKILAREWDNISDYFRDKGKRSFEEYFTKLKDDVFYFKVISEIRKYISDGDNYTNTLGDNIMSLMGQDNISSDTSANDL